MSSGLSVPLYIENTPKGIALLGASAFPRIASNYRGKILRGRKLGELDEKAIVSYY